MLIAVVLLVVLGVIGSLLGADDEEPNDDATTTTENTETTEAAETDTTRSDETTTTTEPESEPTVTAGFTLHDGVPGETWASVGIVIVGGSDNKGSLELTVTLTDAGGTPIATESTYVGVSPAGQEVYASIDFLDNVAAATAVRVDVSDASSFVDGELVPVTVSSYAFDGNFFEISGTATNDTGEPIEFGSVVCVAFRGGAPVAGFTGSLDTIAPGATIAWNSVDTFDPAAEEVRCTGFGGF